MPGYDPSVHPGITHEFQSAAMRFGHTMVPPGVYRRYLTSVKSGVLCLTLEVFQTYAVHHESYMPRLFLYNTTTVIVTRNKTGNALQYVLFWYEFDIYMCYVC